MLDNQVTKSCKDEVIAATLGIGFCAVFDRLDCAGSRAINCDMWIEIGKFARENNECR
jgi:hypothetical protein